MKLRGFALLTFLTFAVQASAQERSLVGDFALQTIEGEELQLSSLRGRVVLLNLWATWCVPCLKEMPDLNEMHQELSPEGLTVVGLTIDGEDKPVIDRFVQRLGVTYPVVYGSVEAAQSILGTNAVPILPTTLLIDREGYIIERIVGTVPIAETTHTLQDLLRK